MLTNSSLAKKRSNFSRKQKLCLRGGIGVLLQNIKRDARLEAKAAMASEWKLPDIKPLLEAEPDIDMEVPEIDDQSPVPLPFGIEMVPSSSGHLNPEPTEQLKPIETEECCTPINHAFSTLTDENWISNKSRRVQKVAISGLGLFLQTMNSSTTAAACSASDDDDDCDVIETCSVASKSPPTETNIVNSTQLPNCGLSPQEETQQGIPMGLFTVAPPITEPLLLSDHVSDTNPCEEAPDGTAVVTNSEDNFIRLFNLEKNDQYSLSFQKAIRQGDSVYDFNWQPDSNLFATTCRDQPILLWDTKNQSTSSINATFQCYNHLDELEAARCLTFTTDGTKIYAGVERAIYFFDISRPGHQIRVMKTNEKHSPGQNGIISCLSPNPKMPGSFAAGSYLRTIGLYDERMKSCVDLLPTCHRGGVTHLCYSPCGNFLLSGARKDSDIFCWDVRLSSRPCFRLQRYVDTNQRIYFEIDRCGTSLFSGSADGVVRIWDVTNGFNIPCDSGDQTTTSVPALPLSATWQLHDSCVNGVSLHPTETLMVTSSGQRVFAHPFTEDFDYEEESAVSSGNGEQLDNSLKLWSYD